MELRELFNVHDARLSMRELHEKTRELKKARRAELAAARALKDDPKAAAPHRTLYWELKRKAETRGSCARLWGLIYAYLRGMPYRRVEAKCRPDNRVSPYTLSTLILEVALDPSTRIPRDGVPTLPAHKSLRAEVYDDIEKWLLAEPAPEQQAA